MPLPPKPKVETSLTQDSESWREKRATYSITVAWFVCTCGNRVKREVSVVRTGKRNHCGCQSPTKGGLSTSPTCLSWRSMLNRCLDKEFSGYASYGGRGITVCERWLDFFNFLEDMGERPPGTTLDRYPDKKGNYEPGNCRWATDAEQYSNLVRNVYLTIDGVTKTISEWSREPGSVPRSTISYRVKLGLSPRECVFGPPLHRGPQASEPKESA